MVLIGEMEWIKPAGLGAVKDINYASVECSISYMVGLSQLKLRDRNVWWWKVQTEWKPRSASPSLYDLWQVPTDFRASFPLCRIAVWELIDTMHAQRSLLLPPSISDPDSQARLAPLDIRLGHVTWTLAHDIQSHVTFRWMLWGRIWFGIVFSCLCQAVKNNRAQSMANQNWTQRMSEK